MSSYDPMLSAFNADNQNKSVKFDKKSGFLNFTKENEKQKRNKTKNDFIYGIWNESEEEQEEKVEQSLQFSAKSSYQNMVTGFRKSDQILNNPDKNKVSVKVKIKEQKNIIQTAQFQNQIQETKEKHNKKKVRFAEDDEVFDIPKANTTKRKFKELYEDEEDNDDNDNEGKEEDDYMKDLEEFGSDKEEQAINQLTIEQRRKKRILNFKKNPLQQNKNSDNDDDDEEDQGRKVAGQCFGYEENIQYYDLPSQFGQKKNKKEQYQTIELGGSKYWDNKIVVQENSEKKKKEKEMKKSYGKGFDLLAKFGYKIGKGLGKNEDGIVKPVEAVQKSHLQNIDLGLNFNKQRQKHLFDEGDENANEENQEEQPIEIKKTWKKNNHKENKFGKNQKNYKNNKNKDGKFKNKQPGRYFQFLDPKNRQKNGISHNNIQNLKHEDIIKNIANNSTMKIIDMRGQCAVQYENVQKFTQDLSNQEKIVQKPQQKQTSVALNKKANQQENCQKILERIQQKYIKVDQNIQNLSHKVKYETDKLIQLKYDQENIVEQQKNDQTFLEGTKLYLQKLKEINSKTSGEISIEALFHEMHQLFKDYPIQFIKYNTENIFVKTFQQKIQLFFQNWEPQKDSSEACKNFERLIELLREILLFKENYNYQQYQSNIGQGIVLQQIKELSTTSERDLNKCRDFIIHKSIFPTLRAYILNIWDPQSLDSDQLIDFFECWQNVIPPESLDQIYEQLVLQKLNQQLKETDFHDEKNMLPHLWLQPWLMVIQEEKMTQIWKNLVSKFSAFIQTAEIGKSRIIELLQPWKNILEKKQFDSLMIRGVIPKLMFDISIIEIDPSNQQIEPIQNVIKFITLLETDQIKLVYEQLIQKIEDVLNIWVTQNQFCENEILFWMQGWELLLGEKIRFQFNENFQKMISSLKSQQQQQ